MKSFFENLFGRKAPPEIPKKRAQAAASNSSRPQQSPTPATNNICDLKPGDFIAGEYRIRRVFGGEGKSGMGVVYLVEARSSEEPFVLKTFQSKRADAVSLARFKAESETWVNIGKHPNIVQCHWVNEFSGQLFVAAEFVWPDNAGRNTLTQYIASGNLSLRRELNWIAQFCFGMKHAMAHGLRAHRDIKPDNLMIDNRGRLLITDFGLAKGLSLSEQSDSLQASQGEARNLTGAGTAFGTPPFMSPEQFLDSSAVDRRADIYSFGVVIYMMISGGRLPIVPAGNSGWALAHRQQRITRFDHPLMHFAEKCLEKDRKRRFQSYDEILDAVAETCRKQGFSVPTDEQDARAEFLRQWSIAMSLSNLGREEEAITKLLQMTEHWPDSSEVYTELGAAYNKLERRQEALKATEKSLELDQYSTAAWNNLGSTLANTGRLAEAKGAYYKALHIEPENTGAMIGLAQLHMADGELKEARQLCELALFWRPEKPNVLMIASACLMQCGENKRSAELLEKLVLLPPDSKDRLSEFKQRTSWFNLALCRHSLGDTEGCMQALQEVLERNPKDVDAWTTKGNVLDMLGRREEAIGCYDKALKSDPRAVTAWRNKGNTLGNLKRYQDALVCYQQAEKLGDSTAARYIDQCQRMLRTDEDDFERGCASYQAGNFEEAIRFYDVALAGDAGNPDIWNNKGAAMLRLNRDSESLVCFDHAISLAPENAKIWNSKGQALLRLGQLGDALPAFHRAVKLDPDYANAWFGQGEALAKLEKHQEAVACYENVVRLTPKDEQAWYYMGYSMGFLGRHGDVIKCCDRALEINPHASRFWILKGLGFCSMDRFHEALQCFQEAEKLGDTSATDHIANCRRSHAEWYFRLGSRYQQEGNHTETIACYEKGLALDPSKTVIWVNKGAALLALDRASEAVACFDRAISLDPRDSSAWNNKGMALISLGQREDGLACITEAYRLRAGSEER